MTQKNYNTKLTQKRNRIDSLSILIPTIRDNLNAYFLGLENQIEECVDDCEINLHLLGALEIFGIHVALLAKELPDEEIKCLSVELTAVIRSRMKLLQAIDE